MLDFPVFYFATTLEACCKNHECDDMSDPAPVTSSPTSHPSKDPATPSPTSYPSKEPSREPTAVEPVESPCQVGPDADPQAACGKGEICAISDADTCSGTCQPADEQAFCPEIYQPVCGCGQTYSNSCFAEMDGNVVKHEGRCVHTPIQSVTSSPTSHPSKTPVTASPTSHPSKEPSNEPTAVEVIPMKWYFNALIEGHNGDRRCVYGTEYTSSWIAQHASLYLFDTQASCCKGSDNHAFDCVDYDPTTAQLSSSPSSRPSTKPSDLATTSRPSQHPSSRPSDSPTKKPTKVGEQLLSFAHLPWF